MAGEENEFKTSENGEKEVADNDSIMNLDDEDHSDNEQNPVEVRRHTAF